MKKHLTLLPRLAAVVFLGAMANQVLAIGGLSGVDSEHSDDTDKGNWSGMIGGVAVYEPEYYGSDDYEVGALPVVVVDYKDTAYFKINTAGVWLWKPTESFRMGAIAQIRPQAWDSDDDSIDDREPLPSNFDEPDTNIEPGVNAFYEMERFTAEARVTSGEDTNALLDLRYNLVQSKEYMLVAKLAVEYLGEDEVNYQWYGDKGSLDNDSATNLSVGIHAIQSITEDWRLLYGVNHTMLDDEVDDSPVGDSDTFTIAFFGVAYAF